MIQLTFQPAFDPYHAVFRALRLRSLAIDHHPLHRDHMRILDFYLLFPFRIEGIRLRREDRKYRKLAGEYEKNKPYGDQPEDRNVFARMEPMQLCALDTLASRRFISPEKWTTAEVVTTSEPVLGALGQRVVEINTQEADLLDFLRVLASYDLLGPDGLKARSALLEARYDAI